MLWVQALSCCVHRNADTLKRLNDTERKLKDQKEHAYIDLEQCEKERESGNQVSLDLFAATADIIMLARPKADGQPPKRTGEVEIAVILQNF